uniref:Uncharacterized protein n=1 Tax=Arundo donax TaxID=35708 RepID=A0A0A9FAP1_ARUDO
MPIPVECSLGASNLTIVNLNMHSRGQFVQLKVEQFRNKPCIRFHLLKICYRM